MFTPLWLHSLTRPSRHRAARRRYWRSLRALYTADDCDTRADLLGDMAVAADDAGCALRSPDPAIMDWFLQGDLLRHLSATQRYCILTEIDQDGRTPDGITGPRYRDEWEDLARAAKDGNRDVAAAILGSLSRTAGLPATAAQMLRLIARTELAVAEAAGRSR